MKTVSRENVVLEKLKLLLWLALPILLVITAVPSRAEEPAAQSETTVSSEVFIQTEADQEARQLIVYYFHGNKRCLSCRKIEIFTHEALESNFTELLESGRIKWEAVNTDNPKHKHFIEDFQLYTKSVVLVDMEGNAMLRWKNLKDVWNLTRKKEAFHEYITAEVSVYLQDEE